MSARPLFLGIITTWAQMLGTGASAIWRRTRIVTDGRPGGHEDAGRP